MQWAVGIQTTLDGQVTCGAVERLNLQHRFDQFVRGWNGQRCRARNVTPCDENRRAARYNVADKVFNAFRAFVGLAKNEQGKIRADENHRAMADLGGAEGLGMETAGFLELQRRFLCDREAWAATDHI